MASRANTYPSAQESFPRSLFGGPTRRSYRAAIKEIILNVKAQYGLSDWDLAERIGVHKDTIENAQEEVNNLDVVTLLNLAWAFGEEAINPVRALYLCAVRDPETITEKRRRLLRELSSLEDD